MAESDKGEVQDMASVEKRTRQEQRRYVRSGDRTGEQKVKACDRRLDAERYYGASLISRGAPVVLVSRWMGHSSPEITWRVYSYTIPKDDQVGREILARISGNLAGTVGISWGRSSANGI